MRRHSLYKQAQLGIGIEETNAGICITASRILVRYQIKKMPDCVNLFRYQSCPALLVLFIQVPD
jgi:hypothetical protein